MARGRFYNVDPSPENLRAIWSQLHGLTDQVAAAQSTIDTQAATITALHTQLVAVRRTAASAVILAGQPSSPVTAGGTITPPAQPTSDGGLGEQGCSQAGADGHVPDAASLVTLGKIVCGTGAEFPALLAVAANQADRDAQRYELLGRMIWHINLNGGFGGVSRYPGNLFDVLVQLGSVQYAYRVTDYAEFGVPMTTTMVYGGQTAGASTVPDPGISD